MGCLKGGAQQDPGHGGKWGSLQDTGHGCSLPTGRSRSKGRGEFRNHLHAPWESKSPGEHGQIQMKEAGFG